MKKLPSLLDTTKEKRRVYTIELKVNNRELTELIIDPHYELKHSEYVNDELIYQNPSKNTPTSISGEMNC